MTGFLIAAALLLAAGIVVLLRPLLRSDAATPARDAGAVVAQYRDKLRELEAERAAATLDAAQYDANRREIERQLLDAVAQPAAAPSGPGRARWTAALVGLLIVILPIVLYAALGTPEAMMAAGLEPAAATGDGGDAQGGQAAGQGKAVARPLTSAQVQKMIDGLNEALAKNPGDAAGWSMLARAYAYQHQYPEAVRAYTKAVALTPKDARLLADLADAMAMTSNKPNDQRLDGEPLKLIERALQLDPHEVKALALAGTAAFDHQQYARAVDYWERAIAAAPSDPEFAQSLRNSLAEARQLAGKGGGAAPQMPAAGTRPAPATAAAPAGAAVRGRVVLSAALKAKAAPGDTVFVFARAAQGPKVPLALVRRQVRDLPFEFSLDDSMAMMPDFTLSKYSPVVIGARISKSGDAIAAPGDLQGFSGQVTAGTSGITVTIDQVVP